MNYSFPFSDGLQVPRSLIVSLATLKFKLLFFPQISGGENREGENSLKFFFER